MKEGIRKHIKILKLFLSIAKKSWKPDKHISSWHSSISVYTNILWNRVCSSKHCATLKYGLHRSVRLIGYRNRTFSKLFLLVCLWLFCSNSGKIRNLQEIFQKQYSSRTNSSISLDPRAAFIEYSTKQNCNYK